MISINIVNFCWKQSKTTNRISSTNSIIWL